MASSVRTDPGPEAEPRAGREPVDPDYRQALRTAAMIQGALLCGMVMLTVVMALLVSTGKIGGASAAVPKALPVIGYALAATMIPAGLLLRRTLLKRGIDPSTGTAHPSAVMQATVVSAAMFESVGMFGAVLVLLTGDLMPGVLLAAVSALVLLTTMPGMPWTASRRTPTGYAEPERWKA